MTGFSIKHVMLHMKKSSLVDRWMRFRTKLAIAFRCFVLMASFFAGHKTRISSSCWRVLPVKGRSAPGRLATLDANEVQDQMATSWTSVFSRFICRLHFEQGTMDCKYSSNFRRACHVTRAVACANITCLVRHTACFEFECAQANVICESPPAVTWLTVYR